MRLVEEKVLKVIEFTEEELANLCLVLDLATFEQEENADELSGIADNLYTELKFI